MTLSKKQVRKIRRSVHAFLNATLIVSVILLIVSALLGLVAAITMKTILMWISLYGQLFFGGIVGLFEYFGDN